MRNLAGFTTADYLTQDSHHVFWFMVRVSFAMLAVWVAVTEPWDVNGDELISVHEILLLGVRLLAFPLHLLLSLTPSAALHFVGLPDAYWPSSAIIAIVISLPLWGLLLVGGLIMEAWLEWTLNARGNVHLD